MTIRILPFLFFAVLLFQTGCKAKYIDVSENTEFSHLIGEAYIVHSDLHVIGGYWGNEKEIEFYVIYKKSKVGGGGPGVASSGVFPKGSKFRIMRILKCTNCLLESPISVEVEVLDTRTPFKKGVSVSLDDQDFFVIGADYELIALDKLLFKKL
jgi:hypothetical protein